MALPKLIGKPRPGVCDICGHAVPRFPFQYRGYTFIQGHLLDHKNQLVRVGCREHSPDLYKSTDFEDNYRQTFDWLLK